MLDLVRSGALVIARVDECDSAAAVAAMVRSVDDPVAAANACVGSVALREVRLTC